MNFEHHAVCWLIVAPAALRYVLVMVFDHQASQLELHRLCRLRLVFVQFCSDESLVVVAVELPFDSRDLLSIRKDI